MCNSDTAQLDAVICRIYCAGAVSRPSVHARLVYLKAHAYTRAIVALPAGVVWGISSVRACGNSDAPFGMFVVGGYAPALYESCGSARTRASHERGPVYMSAAPVIRQY
jgi:hypothetical protein